MYHYFLVNEGSNIEQKFKEYKTYRRLAFDNILAYVKEKYGYSNVATNEGSRYQFTELLAVKANLNDHPHHKYMQNNKAYIQPKLSSKEGKKIQQEWDALRFHSKSHLLSTLNLSNVYLTGKLEIQNSDFGEIGDKWILIYPSEKDEIIDLGADLKEIKKWEYEKLLEEYEESER